jgi:hypothetical protein
VVVVMQVRRVPMLGVHVSESHNTAIENACKAAANNALLFRDIDSWHPHEHKRIRISRIICFARARRSQVPRPAIDSVGARKGVKIELR